MSTQALQDQIRAQVRQALSRAAASPAASAVSAAAPQGAVVVPLRVGSPQDTAALAQLFQRLAANPALLQMADAGLLRFDLRVDASALQSPAVTSASAMAATTATDPAACCESCKAGKACECHGPDCKLPHVREHATAELAGVIGERQVKAIAAGVNTVRLKPGAVLTPLGKDALRKRGITLDKGKTP